MVMGKGRLCQQCCVRGCRFFTFVLLLFLLHSMGISLFRLTGSICRDETIASTGGVRHCWALRCKHAGVREAELWHYLGLGRPSPAAPSQ